MAIGYDSIWLVLHTHHVLSIFPGGREQRSWDRTAEEQPLAGDDTTETIRGLDVILCSDTLLSLLPSRTRARRSPLAAGLQSCAKCQCQVPLSLQL